jgi:hypothetical protein
MTNVRYETQVAVEADHDKISCLKVGSPELNSICRFLDETIRQALVRIRRPSDDCKFELLLLCPDSSCLQLLDVIPAALDQQTVVDDETNEFEGLYSPISFSVSLVLSGFVSIRYQQRRHWWLDFPWI